MAKKSESNRNSPKWTELTRRINTFCNETAPDHIRSILCQTYDDDKIAQLGTMASRSQGSTEITFYGTILLFLMHQEQSGAFSDEFLGCVTSLEDQSFPRRAGKILIDKLAAGSSTVLEEQTRDVRPHFIIREEQHSKFDEFFRRHSIPPYKEGERRQLQCVAYRPMRSNPCEVMKTYISISEQRDPFLESRGYIYTHIYEPPKALQRKRFSGGRVLPLDDALYLLGGQRPLEDRLQPLPFDSVKVVAIRWQDIERFHNIFPALVMTTNYTGKIMVSRAAIRLTPIGHSDDIPLKSVPLSDLQANLENDLKLEAATIDGIDGLSEKEASAMKEVFPLFAPDFTAGGTAQQIASMCNNDPHTETGWAVPEGFSRIDKRRTKRVLTTEAVNFMVSDALGGSEANPFKNDRDETFNLWLHTRFGPLALD